MKKKGFTLIELLAVIVILAIIALIAVPIILNVIDKAKKGSAESSALGYIDAVEKYAALNGIDKTKYPYTLKNNTYNVISEVNGVPGLNTFIEIKGEKPSKGTVTLNKKGRVTSAELGINGYRIVCSNDECRAVGTYDTFIVTYNINSVGTLDKTSDSVKKGLTVALPTPVGDETHEFLGWFTEEDGGTEVTNSTPINDDMILYAHWREHELYEENLVDFWKLETDLNNSITGRNNLIVYSGSNYSFSDDCLYTNDTAFVTSANYSLPSTFTVVLKYKPTSLNPWTLVVGKITDYYNQRTYNGIFIHGNLTTARLSNGTDNSLTFDPTNILTVNEWSTLSFTYDGSNSRLYKDGILIIEQANYTDLNSQLFLGGSKYSGTTIGGPNWKYANGYYKDFRIYDRALTSEELKKFN